MPEEIIYELTGVETLGGQNALPNIIVTRYEANKKEGFVGINTLGEVNILMRFYHAIIVNTIEPSGAIVAVNWERGCKFDVTISDSQSFKHRKCFNGQEVVIVFNNIHDTDIAILNFTTEDGEIIKWLGGETPTVNPLSNAIITFYKSNKIIYAEIKRDYSEADSSDSDSGS